MTELSPVVTATDAVARRYTDESDGGAMNGGLRRRKSSLDVPLHDRITLAWTHIDVHVVPETSKCRWRRRPERPAEATQHKQILYDGLSRIIIIITGGYSH